MNVEKLKYVVWAKEMDRAVRFYCEVFDAQIVRRSDVMAEVAIAGSLLGIHEGGEITATVLRDHYDQRVIA